MMLEWRTTKISPTASVELIAGEHDLTEQTMFGGLRLSRRRDMAVAASGQGGLMVRVEPEDTDALVAKRHARPFDVGRPMQGWLRVDAEGVQTKRQLEPWVNARRRLRALPSLEAVSPSLAIRR